LKSKYRQTGPITWPNPAAFMRWLQLRFDFDSTGMRLLIKGHWGHSDVTH